MTATVAKLTIGQMNAIFRASGDTVEVIVHDLDRNEVTRTTETLVEGRRQFAMLRGWGYVKGVTRPTWRQRKLTTDAQFAAWARQAFDLENDDNAPESLLASEEQFADLGYLEVAA